MMPYTDSSTSPPPQWPAKRNLSVGADSRSDSQSSHLKSNSNHSPHLPQTESAEIQDASFFNQVFNTPLRHLASHSSLNTISSQGSTFSRGQRSTGSNVRSYASQHAHKRQFRPMSTNYEEQRHEGNGNVRISKTTKIFEPQEIAEGKDTNDNGCQVGEAKEKRRSSDTLTNSNNVKSDLSDEEKATQKEEEDDNIYPGPLGLTFLSIGLMLCVFLIALDRTIITPVSFSLGHDVIRLTVSRPYHIS